MMKKENKGSLKYIITIVLIGCVWCASVVLYALGLIRIVPFVVANVIFSICLVGAIVAYIRYKKQQAEKVKSSETSKVALSDEDLIKLYNLAGIPVLRDSKGKIKNIFELLGIEALYDENGNRIATIYEKLGIVPRFSKDGKELPTILAIKNRIRGLVKPGKAGSLTRVLTEKEKEELMLKEMLEQKLKEAIESGDKDKIKAIKKVVSSKKKEESSWKPTVIKVASGSSIKLDKISGVKMETNPNLFKDLFSRAGGSDKKPAPVPVVERPVFKKPENIGTFRVGGDESSKNNSGSGPRTLRVGGVSGPDVIHVERDDPKVFSASSFSKNDEGENSKALQEFRRQMAERERQRRLEMQEQEQRERGL